MTETSDSDPLGLVGTTIAEKYAVEAVVGEGGFAVVYRATHTLMKRRVAVKVFKALSEVPEDQRARMLEEFIQEGRVLAELSERSAAIVQARDIGTLTTPGGEVVPYMVLEWLEGASLEGVLVAERAQGLPLRSLAQAIALLGPVADALGLAHAKGIAHRDIKPANVFVLGDPRAARPTVKLLDFGIAKVVQDAQKRAGAFSKTGGQVTSFTPQYGAPEQFDRGYGATGPWTDVFALALMATEVITGEEALRGETLVQLAVMSSKKEIRPTPRARGADVSDEVEAVFEKALAVPVEERYASASDLWRALRSAAGLASVGTASMARLPVADGPPSGFASTQVAAPAVEVPAARTDQGVAHSVAGSARMPSRSRVPLFLGAAIALLALAGVGAALARYGGLFGAPTAAAPVAASATASATAVPSSTAAASVAAAPAKACPSGMMLVAGGEFFMGSSMKQAEKNELPPHPVTLASYCLDRTEVTVEAYRACSDVGKCLRAGTDNDAPELTLAQQKVYDPVCNARDPKGKAKHPVNCVDWEQAHGYCAAQGGRLPTEAEWEFAARGSDGRVYPWGDDPPSGKLLNACGKECLEWGKKYDPSGGLVGMFPDDDGYETTAPVGSFPAGRTAHGIDDMVGNVWEWVGDWYDAYPEGRSAVKDPQGPAVGKERVIRGGSWNGGVASWVRPTFRYARAPSIRSHGIGFRCARTL